MKKLVLPILFLFALSAGVYAQSYDENMAALKALMKERAQTQDPARAAQIDAFLNFLRVMPRDKQLDVLKTLERAPFPQKPDSLSQFKTAPSGNLDKALFQAVQKEQAKKQKTICDHCCNPVSDKCEERGGLVPCQSTEPVGIDSLWNGKENNAGGSRALLPQNHNPEEAASDFCPECGIKLDGTQAHRCKTFTSQPKPAKKQKVKPVCASCGETASDKCKNRGYAAPCIVNDTDEPTWHGQDLPANHKQEKAVERCPECGIKLDGTQAHRCKTQSK